MEGTELIRVPFGKDPVNLGDYDELVAGGQTSFGIKNRVNRYGCEWESLVDNNTDAPAVWDGGDTITPSNNWKLNAGNPDAWLMSLNKPAQSEQYPFNGMGRVKLLKHLVEVEEDNVTVTKNLLYQDDFYKDGPNNTRVPNTNTVFEVPYEFELAEDITIPAGCVLDFKGGSISAGSGTNENTIIGNGTIIDAPITKIFSSDIVLSKDIQSVGRLGSGWRVPYIYAEWFGAKGDNTNDDTLAIQSAVDNAHLTKSGIGRVRLLYNRVYKVSDTIVIPSAIRFGGEVESEAGDAGSFRPTLFQSNPSKDVIKLYDANLNSQSINRLYICDLLISGSNKNANCGINYVNRRIDPTDPEEPICGIGETTFDGLFIENVKYGIYIDTEECLNCSVKNVCNNPNNTVGIAAYIKIDGLYGFDFRDCYFMRTYIGGVLIHTKGNSKPIEFYNCLVESCGNEYNLDDYNDYGCFGIHFICSQNIGYINILNSYFESNCPCRAYGDGTTYTKYGYTESANPDEKYIYITNPDFRKTADIIIEGIPETDSVSQRLTAIRANIQDCHISTNLQAISVVDSGIINYENNRLFIPGRNIPVEKSIIKVFSGIDGGRHISITVKDNNHSGSKEYETNIKDVITTVVELEGNPVRCGFDVDYPALNEKYFYNAFPDDVSYGDDAVFYLKMSNVGEGIGLPFSPVNSITNLIQIINRPSIKPQKCKVILLDDCELSDSVQKHFPAGIDYTFVSKEGSTFNITRANSEILNFYDSSVTLKNINITLTGPVFLYTRNCNVKYFNCGIVLQNQPSGVLRAEGTNKLSLDTCNISLQNASTDTTTMLNMRSDNNTRIFTSLRNCTNTNNVQYIDDTYVSTSGAFADKPDAKYIYVGFKYFCTDRQTAEGATDGIEIVHKGNNVWVDALGRTIS